MSSVSYSYQDTYDAALRVNWKISDIIGGEKRLDFTRRFLPEGLARVEELEFLNEDERRILNQIRGHEYLSMFGVVEEFILPFVLDHARSTVGGDAHQTRALLNFAGEEMKHIQLFHRFQAQFEKGFGTRCRMSGAPDVLGAAVLAHHPLGVALIVLHVEWMTQRHYLDSMRPDATLDPLFKSLLKHHWMEEAQHAKLDSLMLQELAASASPEEINQAFEDYLHIIEILDDGLNRQTGYNLESFMKATGRVLSDEELRKAFEQQYRAVRWTYLGTGLTHPHLLETLERLSPALRKRAEEIAPKYC